MDVFVVGKVLVFVQLRWMTITEDRRGATPPDDNDNHVNIAHRMQLPGTPQRESNVTAWRALEARTKLQHGAP